MTSGNRILEISKRIILWAILVPGLGIPVSIQAATFTVNSTRDAVDDILGNGVCATKVFSPFIPQDCTLRAAIQETNALAGADTIILPAGTYTLTLTGAREYFAATGDLNVQDDLTISGAGANSTVIDGNQSDRVFTFGLFSSERTYTLHSVTIQNGINVDGGGGVLVGGNIDFTLYDSIVKDNSAIGVGGGIGFSSDQGFPIPIPGNSSLTNVVITGNSVLFDSGLGFGQGGGIWNENTVTLTDVTIENNSSVQGGGIFNRDDSFITLKDSLVTGNTATEDGGGIYFKGVMNLSNVTVSNNTATVNGGGIYQTSIGSLDIVNSTITENTASQGGGIYSQNLLDGVPTNTIISNNAGGNCNVVLSSGGYNLEDTDTCGFVNSTDLINTDPLLGPLADNDGPTETHALLAGSPAVDGGLNGACPGTDQRGLARTVDGDGDGSVDCDIGAYELESTFFTVNSTMDAVDADTADTACETVNGNGICTLRAAIQQANALNSTYTNTILVPTGTYTLTLAGANENLAATGDLDVTDHLILSGEGAATTIIDGGALDRVLDIDPGNAGITVGIDNVTVQNGSSPSTSGGGGIQNRSILILSNIAIANSTSAASGGGIFNTGAGMLTIIESSINGNTGFDGGGIFTDGGTTLTILDSTIQGNSAPSVGGINNQGTLTITASTISGNMATNSDGIGAGLFNNDTADLINSTISGNTTGAAGSGGGIKNNETLILSSVTITDNSASSGGGIDNGGTATIENSIIAANGVDDCNNIGTIATNVNNLIGDGSCTQNAVNLLSGDPGLGPLGDNGGLTETHAVLSGSPVIDAGDATACATLITDQTGMPRPIDGDGDNVEICDIGAFEFVDMFGPEATLASAPDVTVAGATSYDLVVNYSDDAPIDVGKLDSGDIAVTGPNGALVVVAASAAMAGTVVTYTLTPAGGSWDAGDNGAYSIDLNGGQVFDLATTGANAATAAALGGFDVTIGGLEDLIFADGYEGPPSP